MIRKYALYPFLFILFLVLNPLVGNFDQIDPFQALRPLILLLLVSIGLILMLYAILKDWDYASYLIFLGLVFVFVFGHLIRVIEQWLPDDDQVVRLVLLGIWSIILVVMGLKKLFIRFGSGERVTPLLNLIFSFAFLGQIVYSVVLMFQGMLPIPFANAQEAPLPNTGTTISLDCTNPPDIYYIVLDGYGRADVLEEIYGVDTRPFLESLTARGFYIADQSHANYIQTVYAIPSALNFSYMQPKPKGVSGYDYFPQLIADNQVLSLLQQCDYQMVAFETGFFFTNYPRADVYLSAGSELNEFEGLLLADTPVDMLLVKLVVEPPERSYAAHRQRVLYTFEQLQELPEMRGPKLIFAHIVSPHPPFVFDAQGNPIQPNRSYSIGDGNDYRGTWQEYRQGYAGQVQFVNRMLEETVDAIIRKSPQPPVIILQGDHGPGGHLQWKSPVQTCLWERTPIFNAYYLPGGGEKRLYPDISPVNSFRVVLNEYFGTDFELLPGETLFTSHIPGADFIDITANRDSKNNCN